MSLDTQQNPISPSKYWISTRTLTFRILIVWFVLVFFVVLAAPGLSVTVFGIPLGYWLISSFLLPSFLVLIVYYAWRMDRLESDTMKNSNECLNSADPQNKPETGSLKAGDTNHEIEPNRAK